MDTPQATPGGQELAAAPAVKMPSALERAAGSVSQHPYVALACLVILALALLWSQAVCRGWVRPAAATGGAPEKRKRQSAPAADDGEIDRLIASINNA
jgi:hypothetical protein